MSEAKFSMWFGTREASEDELSRIEEIEVTQEMDKFWEARVRMTMCLDAQGNWQHRPDTVAAPFSRVRIELDPGSGSFVPLIDGPIASFDSKLDSQPGRSTATFVVRDDSVLLDRDDDTIVFREQTDSQVADTVLREVSAIKSARVQPATKAKHPTTTRRGTRLMFLGELARANGRRVYVLPGPKPNTSIGCFLPDPAKPDGTLPALHLIGDDRNLGDATIEEDSEAPERTRGRTLRLSDGVLATAEVSAIDIGIGGDRPAVPADLTPLRLLPPDAALREDSTEATTGRAHESGFAYKITSSVIPGCYGAVLTPYVMVQIECGRTPYSGNYLITKVVHRITPSIYTQSFEAKGNASTDVAAAPVAEAPGGGLSISFSASVGVF